MFFVIFICYWLLYDVFYLQLDIFNQLSFTSFCSLSTSRWKVWMWMHSMFLISRSIKLKSKDVVLTGLMEESIVCWAFLTLWMNSLLFLYILYLIYLCFFFLAYMSSPCHIELILSEKEEPVQKEVYIGHFAVKSWFICCIILICRFSCSLRPSWQQTRRSLKLFEVVLHLRLLLVELIVEGPSFLDYGIFVALS